MFGFVELSACLVATVQSPDKPAQQLLLLFHGVGDNPVAMGEIGSWFAPLFPDALVARFAAGLPTFARG